METENEREAVRNNILVAYFSWSGNAKTVAEQIAQETGGDLCEIRTVNAYPKVYDECVAVAKDELQRNARPVLAETVNDANIQQYNVLFLCYPNWWSTIPMGVCTFLESCDTTGKTVYPVVMHGGSKFGNSLGDIKKLCPNAIIGKGIDISAFSRSAKAVESESATEKIALNSDVTAWLNAIGNVGNDK
ncbi:MAG: hypothetical protein LBL41_02715 [Bifidobacteriaceae bacterium]|jgi:flavodoxin|nr:hypothetical protein [Bifidobacteriaceae bacterium]